MELTEFSKCIPAMTLKHIDVASKAEESIRSLDRVQCVTQHTLHSGIYSRTLFMPKGSVVAGVIIQVPTTLILSGKMAVYIGEEVKHIDGYNVVPTLGNRKQVVYAIEDSYATLLFKTEAKTIEEAEQEMTSEYERLMSRSSDSVNLVTITGE